jgi:serine protease Do
MRAAPYCKIHRVRFLFLEPTLKKLFVSLLVLCTLIFSARADQTPDTASPDLVQSIAAQVRPSLVRIHVVTGIAGGGREAKSESYGSGVIISPDGFVVTNHHVAANAVWISCTLSNREQVEAKLIGSDALSDIAVIQLDTKHAPYSPARWGKSATLRVGDPVLAMGSPLALSQSVTSGIISNTELVMPGMASSGFILDGEDVGSIVRWIGHDAAIHPGNSGGPLINLRGEVVGINEISLGLSGAIPAELAREVAEQLIAGGKVLRAFSGVELQPRLESDTRPSGVLVSGVLPASPAAKAGLKAGDLLLAVGDETLDAKFAEQLPLVNLALTRLSTTEPSDWKVERDGKTLIIAVAPTARELAAAPAREVAGWGLTGSDITAFMAREYSLPGTSGVLVTGVVTGGPSSEAQPAIEPADVIAKVGDRAIASLADLQKLSQTIPKSADGTPTLVEILRGGERILTIVAVHKQPVEDTSVEVARPFFPGAVQVLTPILAEALKLPESTQGVRVTQLYPNGAAQAAGLQVGDVLTKMDGLPIEATSAEDEDIFPAMIRQYEINATIALTILRRGASGWSKPQIKKLVLPQAPKGERELQTYRSESFGLTLRSITYADRLREMVSPGETGAMVTAVEEGSWAALAGLEAGHVIRSIDGHTVRSMEEARNKLRALEKARPKSITLFISSGIHTAFVELRADWPNAAIEKNAATP